VLKLHNNVIGGVQFQDQLNGLVGAGRVNMAHFHADHAARLLI
jgi:hypothetical protein